MPYFTLMVIGENAENQLAPYSENIDVPEYQKEIVPDEDKKDFIDFYVEKDSANSGLTFEELYDKHGDDWNSKSWKNVDGVLWQTSTYNPIPKWDWYKLGGRWAGSIHLKETVSNYEKPSFSYGWDQDSKNEVLAEKRTDSAIKKDIKNIDELSTFAVLKDSEWYERGKMGWFGMAHNEMDKKEWDKKLKELINSLPDDTLISIYDCHI